MRRRSVALLLLLCCSACPGPGGQPTIKPPTDALPAASLKLDLVRPGPVQSAEPAPVLRALKQECSRSMAAFSKEKEPKPYFLSYLVRDHYDVLIDGTLGAVVHENENRRRSLSVEVRVGDYKRDNTNPIGYGRFGFFGSWLLPVEDDPDALRPTIWLATEKQFRRAKEGFAQVKANLAVKAKAEDNSDDFSREEKIVHIEPKASVEVDLKAWQERVKRYSAMFKSHPEIMRSGVQFRVQMVNRYLVNSEQTEMQSGSVHVRLSFFAAARHEDGMDLFRHDAIDAGTVKGLAGEDEITKRIAQVIADVKALKKAPLADPYVGPAILEGKAAGVYFHEIFGHRVEGHRQKSHREGQTFAKKVGKGVLPAFIDVYDDPKIASLNGVELNGFYRVDDEGVESQKADLVQAGVLKGFLMSRSPTRGFFKSNGHGRSQEGRAPVARQGNLIVHPRKVTTPEALKAGLLAEVKRQGKPYGLRFTLVDGGFTNTSRYGAQFFKVKPVLVYKVYPDGKEELVRGADIEGTPLTSISQIKAAANDMTVFNGYCGAESGMVPVSASAPSLLVSKVEIARKMTGKEKPPILPPPGAAKGGAQ